MTRRAEQYEQDERAKARARVYSPITEQHHAHTMGKVRASTARLGDSDLSFGLMVVETIKRNNDAYQSVAPQLDELWKTMQVKRRFDRSG